jgi:hypothetical protein
MPDLQDVPPGSRVRLPCGCVGVRCLEDTSAGTGIAIAVEGESFCQPHNGMNRVAAHPRTQVVLLGTAYSEELPAFGD